MSRILIFLTGRNLTKISQAGTAQTSIITEKTIRDFTRVIENQRANQRSRAIKEEIERLDRLFGNSIRNEHQIRGIRLRHVRPDIGRAGLGCPR